MPCPLVAAAGVTNRAKNRHDPSTRALEARPCCPTGRCSRRSPTVGRCAASLWRQRLNADTLGRRATVIKSAVLELDTGGNDGGAGNETWTLIRPDLGLFAVAVPVGWSSLAATSFLGALAAEIEAESPHPPPAGHDAIATFRSSVLRAQAAWDATAADSRELRRVGAAIGAARFLGSDVVVACSGNCRILNVRGAQVIDEIRPDIEGRSATRGPDRRQPSGVSPEFDLWSVRQGDALALLAGACGVIDDVEIIQVVSDAPSARAASQLTEIARARSPDEHLATVCCHLR